MASENFEKAVKAWVGEERECDYLADKLSNAYARRDRTANELAKLIIPRDVKQDELIAVWVRTARREEQLVTVKWLGGANYEVSFRGKPRNVNENGDPELD